MRIALAQIDTTVGAFADNARAIEQMAERAASSGARLVVFPELALHGYPPRDLLELPDFLAAGEAAMQALAKRPVFEHVAGLVGFAERHRGSGAGLFNACALIDRGAVLAVARKMLLPTYDVFDEGRYFDPAPEPTLVSLDGVQLGITICEDLWNDKQFWRKPRYARDPVEELAAAGARAILNLSASPYALGKAQHRRRMLAAAARRHGLSLAVCNLVGGNDSLLFDGRSALYNPDGALLEEAPAFEEALVVAELPLAEPRRVRGAHVPSGAPLGSERPDPRDKARAVLDHETTSSAPGALAVVASYESDLSDTTCAELAAALTMGIRDYAHKTGFGSAVLGLSGGIDSSLTAVLAARALGPAQVTGIAMPSRYTASMSNEDAQLLAERLGIRFETVPIEPVFQAYAQSLAGLFAGRPPDVTEENLQARIRGMMLMAFSNKTAALLLSTGNKSELGTGFCTLYGDMAGGLAAIGDLPKTCVYAVSRWLNKDAGTELIPERVLLRPPTAELRENQTDQDTLPPYDQLDAALRGHVEERLGAQDLLARGIPEPVVRRVLRLVVASEYKRRQAAPVLRVTARAFGEGWRFPIAHGFRPAGA